MGKEINAAVDDAEGVEVDVVVFACDVEGSIGDPFILLLEKCGESWTIATSVLRNWRQYLSINIVSQYSFEHTDSVQMLILSSLGL